MSIADCKIIDLPKIHDPRGNLTFIETGQHVPFEIKRVYYLYDVPGGATRAGHAHKQLHQLIIAMSGSFDITLDDGYEKQTYHLKSSIIILMRYPKYFKEVIFRYYELRNVIWAKLTKNKLVSLNDAEFILSLRLDENKNKHLSSVANNLNAQKEWIESYKKREENNLEYYYIIVIGEEKLGTVRLYDFKGDSFSWGSWILKKGVPPYAAIESALLVYEIAFYKLGFKCSHFDVRKDI